MRFEFDYEIGEIIEDEDRFDAYFPEFDLVMSIPVEFHKMMEACGSIYCEGRKDKPRKEVLVEKMEKCNFDVVERKGLKMERPIVFFDLETTGVDLIKDQVLEICITKVYVNGSRDTKTRLVKPTIPIPQDAIDIHGIDEEKVKGCPIFGKIAKSLRSFIAGCDIGGYNSTKYDVPFLQEEFISAGIMDWPEKDTKFLDAMVIFHKNNPRDLTAAYKHYCGKDLEGAHGAEADVTASIEVLEAQIQKYDDLPDTVEGIHKYCSGNMVDYAGTIVKDDGVVVYNIGKDKGKSVKDNPGFGEWMLKTPSFCTDTKMKVRALVENK